MADLGVDIPEENLMTLDALKAISRELSEGDVILDVRRADEFQAGHIAGAINFSHESVAEHATELKKYKKIYIHCQRGRRSQAAYDSLKKAGLTNLVCIADAGIAEWDERGYPLER